jgi:hypothetical protein
MTITKELMKYLKKSLKQRERFRGRDSSFLKRLEKKYLFV